MEQPICRENKAVLSPQNELSRSSCGCGPWAMERQLLAGEQRRGRELINSTNLELPKRFAGIAGVPPAMSAKREKINSQKSARLTARLRAGRPRSQHITGPLGIGAVYVDEEILSSCRTERIVQVLVCPCKVSAYTCQTAAYNGNDPPSPPQNGDKLNKARFLTSRLSEFIASCTRALPLPVLYLSSVC